MKLTPLTAIWRRVLAGALALGFSTICIAQAPGTEPQLDYPAATDYSTANEGVSMLAMQSGEIIFEEYANGGGPDIPWVTASGTKSFWGVLLAAMVQDGEARIDELVSDTITEWQADPLKREITVSHLLSMTDGLAGQAPGPDPVETYAEAVALPTVSPPGTTFVYRPASFQIFGEWVRRKVEADTTMLSSTYRHASLTTSASRLPIGPPRRTACPECLQVPSGRPATGPCSGSSFVSAATGTVCNWWTPMRLQPTSSARRPTQPTVSVGGWRGPYRKA